jgi:hypothetical protein
VVRALDAEVCRAAVDQTALIHRAALGWGDRCSEKASASCTAEASRRSLINTATLTSQMFAAMANGTCTEMFERLALTRPCLVTGSAFATPANPAARAIAAAPPGESSCNGFHCFSYGRPNHEWRQRQSARRSV